jgi:hypothetical protein
MSPILQSLANGSARGYGAFVPLGAAGAFESIASATGTGSSGTISFTSIPGTYQHLQLRGIARSTNTSTDPGAITVAFNSDSGTNYAWHNLYGDGASALAAGSSSGVNISLRDTTARNGMAANIMGCVIIDIQDYASTTRNKTLRAFGGTDLNGSGTAALFSGLWINTAALTSISLSVSGAFTTATQFALYGIRG